MSTLTALVPVRTPSAPALGRATVVETRPGAVRVELANGAQVRVELALAYTYEPVRGDEVLVIGNGEGHFVIGILSGAGKSTLRFPGDAELRTERGVLRIVGAAGVELEGPQVAITTDRLQVIANAVVEKLGTLHSTVAGLFSLRSGEMQHVSQGSIHQQSKRASLLTEDKIYINGREVHLG